MTETRDIIPVATVLGVLVLIAVGNILHYGLF